MTATETFATKIMTTSMKPLRHPLKRGRIITMITLAVCGLLEVCGLLSSGVCAPAVAAEVIVIRNVRIDSRGEAGVIESGTVVIRDGFIEAVGKELDAPADADVIDGRGATLTPGLIDSQSRLWLTNTSRGDTSTSAALRTVDSLDPFDETYHQVVNQGITSVVVAPAGRGRLGGSTAVVAASPTGSVFEIPTRDSFKKTLEKISEKQSEPSSSTKPKSTEQPSSSKKNGKAAAEDKKSEREKSSKVDSERDAKEEDKPKKADEEQSSEKEPDRKEKDQKENKDADDQETIEVPYFIARPPMPYSSGKAGWVLSADAAVQASLGIAATDGRSRLSEFDALKKSLKDAEEYHKKWDDYRSWKAKQDKLPPDKKAKEGVKKPPTAKGRAELMRRLAARKAARDGATTKTAEAKKDSEGDKKDESKKDEDDKTEKSKDESGDKEEKAVKKPDFDPAKDRLRPVLRGEIPLRVEVTDRTSLKRALELSEIAKCELILVGLTEVPGKDLQSINWPMVLGPFTNRDKKTLTAWADPFKNSDARICIATFGTSGSDTATLRSQAAAAVAAGIDPDRVMDSITRSAAEVNGLGKWLGRIEPGYRADLVLFAGDPLDPATPVIRTLIAGKTVFESSAKSSSAQQQRVLKITDAVRDTMASLSMPASYVIAGNRILRPNGQFKAGRVTIADGRIRAVEFEPTEIGKDQKGGNQLPVLNLGDLAVMPGLVSAHLTLSSSSNVNEPDSSYFQAANGFDFQSQRTERLVESGVLFAAIAPSPDNVLAGQIAAARLAAPEPILDASIADMMVVASPARRSDRFPASMEGQFDFIRRRFAGELQANRTEMPKVVAEMLHRNSLKRFEQLASGKRIAAIQAETPAELRGSLRLSNALGLNVRLILPSELKPILAEIQSQKIGLVIRPARASDPQWYLQEIRQAAKAGSRLGIAADNAMDLRNTAASLVSQGLKPQRALKVLTNEAARCIGMPKGTATISVGQPADLVVWSGPPYKMTSRCLSVIVDGKTTRQDESSKKHLGPKLQLTRVPAP